MSGGRVWGLTSLALIGFAANSLLCRMALAGAGTIDPISFTAVRIVSGAIVLGLLARRRAVQHGDVRSALALLAYAVPFSLAYVRLAGGTGALILFAAVQLTMFSVAIARGERPTPRTYAGLAIAAGGVVVLALPGARAPDAIGAALMIAAGAAWGVYSLRGRAATDAIGATAGNFLRAAPGALLALGIAAAITPLRIGVEGVLLASASGALASGVGYALWYAALPTLGATRAAIVQLAVPVIAALAAVPLLDEPLGPRLAIAGALVVTGIALAILGRSK